MRTFVVRVWLPDRPGALGAVASRIGAVRGDVVGIDILERGAGRAIDELVIELPTDDLLDLLIEEISQVDGVDVEDVRPVPTPLRDARLDALHTAALLVEQGSVRCLLDRLCEEAHRDFQADWSAVVDLDDAGELACVGEPPSTPWLRAFLAGSGASMPVVTGACGPDDVAWAPLEDAGLALVLGRPSRQFRARERKQLLALARIAGRRYTELIAGDRALAVRAPTPAPA